MFLHSYPIHITSAVVRNQLQTLLKNNEVEGLLYGLIISPIDILALHIYNDGVEAHP